MAILGGAALLEVEINAGLEVFKVLEPEVQKGLIGLFHLFHRKQNEAKAAQAALNPPSRRDGRKERLIVDDPES
jgi:hypothetical protein